MSKSGMQELARLAAQVLDTRKPVAVPQEVVSQLEAEYRIRITPSFQVMQRHQQEGEKHWSRLRLR